MFRNSVLSFILFLGITFSVPIEIMSIESLSLEKIMRYHYKEKVMKDHPNVVSSSIKVVFFNGDELTYPNGSESYQFSFPERSNVLGRTLLPITFVDHDGVQIKRVKIAAEVTAKSYYFRAVKQLKWRHKVTVDDVERVLLDTYGKPPRSFASMAAILGKEVKSTIAKHTIFSFFMVQQPKIVRKGDHVLILLNQEGVSLRLTGRALDDGALNEDIRVKSSYKTRRILQGEVINENTVSIPSMY
jgi:flagella basal body P-ring formation protein FlgA